MVVVAAVDCQYGVSKNGTTPWHIAEDLNHFWGTVRGYPCIGGRNTIHGASGLFRRHGCKPIISSYSEMLFLLTNTVTLDSKLYVVGGADVFNAALPHASKAIITHVEGDYECDKRLDKGILTEYFQLEDDKYLSADSRICTYTNRGK